MKRRMSFTVLSMVLVFMLVQVLFPGCGAKESAFPEKNITYVVPMAAGVGDDTYARGIAPFLKKHLPRKVNVVVENMEGADKARALSYVNKSPPDGYTIGTLSIPGNIISQLYTDLPFDATKFAYFGCIAKNLQVWYVKGDSPLNSLADFKRAAEKGAAENNKLKWLNSGVGGTADVFTRLLFDRMGLTGKVTMITGYKGAKETMTGVMRGDGVFSPATDDAFAAMVKTGDLKVIGVISSKRSRVYPDVPSTAEQGYPEFGEEFVFQRPLFCPPGTPESVTKILEKALQQSLADPELLAWAKKVGFSIDPLNAKETTELVKQVDKSFQKYTPFLKAQFAK